MRSLHLLALAAAIAAAGTACGGDNGNGPSNQNPVANFTFQCTDLACNFTSTSTDDGQVTGWSWNFGDNTDPAVTTTGTAAHTYAAPGTYSVVLTVTDNAGATDASDPQSITVPTANQAPVASFTAACSSLDCTFTNTSTDADGQVVGFAWDFGDGNTSPDQSPTHTYTVTELTPFTVTLTVTDDDGAPSTVTQPITVAPPATLTCGTEPNCSLDLEEDAKVTVTLVSSNCELSGNTFKVIITPPGGGTPVEETLFTDGCNTPDNTSFPLQSDAVFAAGTTIEAQVISGGANLEIAPAVEVSGTYPSWQLNFDDGAKAGPPPEPDFDDLILTIVATPQ